MTRPVFLLTVPAGALCLAAAALLGPSETRTVAVAAAVESAPSFSLPDGLVVREPEMPLGVEGSMLELNRSISQGIRPEANAVVLLVQVFGSDVFEAPLRMASLDMLGIRKLAASPRFQYIDPFVRAHGGGSDEEIDQRAGELNAELVLGSERVWASKADYPQLAEFLEVNRAALDLVVTAADRPHYYAPLLSLEEPMRLLAASFSVEYRLPFIGRCLTARALQRFSAGDMDGAISDLMACHKLAALLANGSPMDTSGAKAHIIDSLTSFAERELATSGKLSPEQAAALLAALLKAPQVPTAEDAANRGERAVLHEELELLRTDEASRQGFFEQGPPENWQALQKIVTNEDTWKAVLAAADAIQDQVVQILAIGPHAEQDARIAEILKESTKYDEEEEGDNQATFAQLAEKDPPAAAKLVGQAMAMALLSNCTQRRHSDDRARMRRDSVIVSLALLVYRGRHGDYPESLAALVPEELAEVPVDAFSEQPLDYKRRAPQHAVLLSWGANRVNDAGALYNDDVIIELK